MATDITELIDNALIDPETPPAPQAPSHAPAPADSPYAEYTAGLERRVPVRSDSGRWLDTYLLTILSAALALPALRAPVGWLALCAVAAIVMLGVDSARTQARKRAKGSADVVVLPTKVVARIGLGFLNPLNWLTALFGAIVALIAGGLIAAAIAAARWVLVEGPDGILAAIRVGVWAHAPTYGAAFACFFLLRAGGHTADSRAAALRTVTRKIPEVALTGIVAVVAIACVAFALGGPRLSVGVVSGADGLGWVPPGLRQLADDGRDDLVTAELDAVTSCLEGDQSGLWSGRSTTGNPLDEIDVATLTADPARPPEQPALAAAALIADNHLAPWIEMIDVTIGDQVVLTVDRRNVARDRPITDADDLRARAVGTPDWLTTVAPQVDKELVLRCSAQTPL